MICLDSDCIIDFLRGKEEAIRIVERHKEELVSTEINIFEVFFGIYNKRNMSDNERNVAKNFFNSIPILHFNEGCGELAAKILSNLLKEGKVIEQNDCFIAATIMENDCNKIITRNEAHYKRIKGIEI